MNVCSEKHTLLHFRIPAYLLFVFLSSSGVSLQTNPNEIIILPSNGYKPSEYILSAIRIAYRTHIGIFIQNES